MGSKSGPYDNRTAHEREVDRLTEDLVAMTASRDEWQRRFEHVAHLLPSDLDHIEVERALAELKEKYEQRGSTTRSLLNLLTDLRTHAKHGGACTCRPCAWCQLWARVDRALSNRR